MKITEGDARALASKIREKLHADMEDRRGLKHELQGIDPDTRAELDKTHTDIIAEEIKKFFA